MAPVVETTFGPGRMIWTVNRELALLIGAGRALLMQLAHPLVAAGVAAHSRFAEDPLGRLVRTLQDGNLPAGYNSVRWNGTTSTGNKVSSGVYYFKVSALGGDTVVRVTVLK